MKKKNIFIYAVALIMSVFAVAPIFAEEVQLDRVELERLVETETSAKIEKKDTVRYFIPTKPNTWAQAPCSGLQMNEFKPENIKKILDSKKPNACKQFDAMSYLIIRNMNQELIGALDKRYDPLIHKTINSSTKKLFSIAAVGGNKEAVDILVDRIRDNGLEVFVEKSYDADIDDVIINELFASVNIIINECKEGCEKLKGLRDEHFNTRYFQIQTPKNQQIEQLTEAIKEYIDDHNA